MGDEIKSIYCHWDGYPSHNGKILLEKYNSQEQAEKLINLGDLLLLDDNADKPEGHTFDHPVEGYCVAYGRDRGEKDTEARTYKNVEEIDEQKYNYYWNDEKWFVNNNILTTEIINKGE